MNQFIRPDLINNQAYQTSKDTPSHRLHMNELPWARLKSATTALNFYPDCTQEIRLQRQLATMYRVSEDQIMLTRGSDEGIDLLMRLLLCPAVDSFLQCPPTFSMYAFFAKLQQARVINCPLLEEDNFDCKVESIKASWQPNCKLIMLCTPNNPTGNCLDLSSITDLCQTFQGRSVVVVDEAYIEFSEKISASCLIDQYDNLVILRTLSKAYGLAGLRLGSILAQSPLINTLKAITLPYRFSNVVLELAIDTLSDPLWFEQKIALIKTERMKLEALLQNYSYIEAVYPSEANFILVKTPYAKDLKDWAFEQGMALRHFADNPKLEHFLRISIGDVEQNLALINMLDSWSAA